MNTVQIIIVPIGSTVFVGGIKSRIDVQFLSVNQIPVYFPG